jgi:hypothetical protein
MGAWKAIGTSNMGTSLQTTSRPVRAPTPGKLVGEDWLVIGVADGAASAPHYEIGAGTAVKCAVTSLAEHVSQDLDGSGRPR